MLTLLTDFISACATFEVATTVHFNNTMRECKYTCYFESLTATNALNYTGAGLHESLIRVIKNLLIEYHPKVKNYGVIMDGIWAPTVKSSP